MLLLRGKMSREHMYTLGRRAKTSKRLSTVSVLVIALIGLLTAYVLTPRRYHSPMEKLAERFYYVDGDELHWNYDDILDAYRQRSDSMQQEQLLNLMVASRAVHLVPHLIDSISTGGFMDTERKIRAIIALTGHDFSKDFDITGIWQKQEVKETKQALREWWDQNGNEVLRSRGPKETFNAPSHWPGLTLELKTEKGQHLQLEPIRLTTVLKNSSDTWFTFTYQLRKPAFAIEYFRVLDDGNLISLARATHPADLIICGSTRRWFAKPRFLVLDGGAFHVCQQWLNHNYESCFEPGKVTIRAVLEPLRGKHKGKQLISNDLTLEILEPQGPDAAAYEFVTSGQVVDISHGLKFGPGWLYGGLCPQASSPHGRPVYEYFVDKYGQSLYANYVRYTLGTDARYPSRADTFCKHMTDIVSIAPRDFPLLANAYVNLLEYYKESGELDKMSALAKTIDPESPNIVDPRLLERLTELTSHVDEVESRIHYKDRSGRTPLHAAAEKGPPALVEFLLSKGAGVDEKDDNGLTPLYLAAKTGHEKIVEILISNGADVNAQETYFGRYPLFWPIVNGNEEIVRILVNAGANVNVQDRSRRTPVDWAAGNNRRQIVKLLMNTKDPNGWTPLHWAAYHGKKAMVQRLISHGARVDIQDNKGQTPLDIAVEHEQEGDNRKFIAEFLRESAGTK